MYKQHDYYDERGRINLAYDHDSESTLDLSTRYAHEASYYSRSYRNLPYQRGARSLTPQGTEPDTQSSCRKRIAVACSRCRKRKIKCSGDTGSGMGCSNCINAGVNNCNFVRVGAREISDIVSDAQVQNSTAMIPPNLPLSPFGSSTKLHGLTTAPYNGHVDKEILVPVPHIHDEDAFYRQHNYGMMPDSRGSFVPTSHGHPGFHDYNHPDRSRRPTLPLGQSTPIMQSIYHNQEPTTPYNAGDVTVLPVSRGNALGSTSSPHMSDEHYTQSQPYLSERQLPPPHPSVPVLPNIYDMSQRPSALYLGAHAPWPTQYSYMRTPIPNDIERNSVSSYRSSSFTDSNGYSLPNTSQSSLSVDVEYNGNDHRNEVISTRPTIPLAEPIRCSEPVMTYEIHKGPENIEVPLVAPHEHHKPVEINGEFSYGRDSKAYIWRSNYKGNSYGEVSNSNQCPGSEISQDMLDNNTPKRIYTLKSSGNDKAESDSTANKISKNTTISPQK